MNTIRQAWDDYRDIVMPYASPGKVKECRRSFYAGAETVLAMILRGGLEPEFQPPLDLVFIGALCDEMTEYLRELKADRQPPAQSRRSPT